MPKRPEEGFSYNDLQHLLLVAEIKNFIRSGEEVEEIDGIKAICEIVEGHEEFLLKIIEDRDELINVRAVASRVLSWKAHSVNLYNERLQSMLKRFSHTKSPLIRLGALLGANDAGDIISMRSYVGDDNPEIDKEARELLEDKEDSHAEGNLL
jgi:hypothetical protein